MLVRDRLGRLHCPVWISPGDLHQADVREGVRGAGAEEVIPMLWIVMRNAALRRHWYVNQMLEGGCPLRWQWHLAMVRAVYGW